MTLRETTSLPSRFRSRFSSWPSNIGRTILASFAIAMFSAELSTPQQSEPPRPPHPILLPEANRLPDVNDQMKMNQQRAKQLNFDAANAARAQQINDDATKLLILARDLNAEVERVGGNRVPSKLLREAEVIALLARDVQNKMVVTVGGS